MTGNLNNESSSHSEKKGGIAVPEITLPQSGSAIRGEGEKSAANPVTGTAP
jgi:hypothetical protein